MPSNAANGHIGGAYHRRSEGRGSRGFPRQRPNRSPPSRYSAGSPRRLPGQPPTHARGRLESTRNGQFNFDGLKPPKTRKTTPFAIATRRLSRPMLDLPSAVFRPNALKGVQIRAGRSKVAVCAGAQLLRGPTVNPENDDGDPVETLEAGGLTRVPAVRQNADPFCPRSPHRLPSSGVTGARSRTHQCAARFPAQRSGCTRVRRSTNLLSLLLWLRARPGPRGGSHRPSARLTYGPAGLDRLIRGPAHPLAEPRTSTLAFTSTLKRP